MLPFKSLVLLDKNSRTPIYLQMINQFIDLIQHGTLQSGQRLISSRALSIQLGVHRKTIVFVYDDLISQGWLEAKKGSGTFVAKRLPIIQPVKLPIESSAHRRKAGFRFEHKAVIAKQVENSTRCKWHLDDGFPDPRLAPLLYLARAYRNQVTRGNLYVKLGYGDTRGSQALREQLAVYLNDTRGLKITSNNVLIVRGTMMGFYLANLALVKKGDRVVMSNMNWESGRMNSLHAGASVVSVSTDKNGMVVDALEKLCKKKPVRMVYVTPHHDYPTSVTLKADRRVKLLSLAEKYGFVIFEDDYDYDFHYESRPILPLASVDKRGMVLYSGSFTKSISPAFRVGYLVGPEEAIEHLAYHRRIIDRQGDLILENAIAELLKENIIQKHLKKALKEYRDRRNTFCDLLQERMSSQISFQIPEGGMAVWANFDRRIDLAKTTEKAFKNNLYLNAGVATKTSNAVRLGFASSNIKELDQCVDILKRSITV
ncbi:MAG TPA: PLP-dependent aminotransferase family protein [Cyclobacteriaceae bacterium]|jgi:GntR family transcriptional regulator/MocR family aminotransferase|nr:PLP-dependent aminotransferase family protein [Cyclobacteriaceae bacterium]